MMPPQFQNQVAYQHMRHQTPSASPPIPSGSVFPHQAPRKHTPQPQLPDKNSSSRNGSSRANSNLVQQLSQPPNGFAYMSNPGMYTSQNVAMPTSHPHALSSHMQAPSMQGPPMQNHSLQGSQYTNYPAPSHNHMHPHQHQMRHAYQEDQRKLSLPPAPQDRLPNRPGSCPPHQVHEPAEVEIKQEAVPAQQVLQPVKRMSVKSRSIFTPIDESRSILSQHWASSTSKFEAPRGENAVSDSRLQSVEGNNSQLGSYSAPTEDTMASQNHTKNSASTPESLPTPLRADSASLAGAKRPVLKVQIPDEPSDEGSATADSASSPTGTNATSCHSRPNGNTSDSLSSGLVLPPPSPSAGGSLPSAGATGPPNPFARPPPIPQNPQSNGINGNTSNGNSNNNNNGNLTSSNHVMETPVSALPSRFMTNDFLPSPSSFYPEWNFRGGDGNTLPSPLNFATPVLGTGPSFLREDPTNKDVNKDTPNKRTSTEDELGRIENKRIKVE